MNAKSVAICIRKKPCCFKRPDINSKHCAWVIEIHTAATKNLQSAHQMRVTRKHWLHAVISQNSCRQRRFCKFAIHSHHAKERPTIAKGATQVET